MGAEGPMTSDVGAFVSKLESLAAVRSVVLVRTISVRPEGRQPEGPQKDWKLLIYAPELTATVTQNRSLAIRQEASEDTRSPFEAIAGGTMMGALRQGETIHLQSAGGTLAVRIAHTVGRRCFVPSFKASGSDYGSHYLVQEDSALMIRADDRMLRWLEDHPKPMLILADEPTGALDSETAAQIMDILVEWNTRGHTLVIVTHDDDTAARCGRRILIQDGVVREAMGRR